MSTLLFDCMGSYKKNTGGISAFEGGFCRPGKLRGVGLGPLGFIFPGFRI